MVLLNSNGWLLLLPFIGYEWYELPRLHVHLHTNIFRIRRCFFVLPPTPPYMLEWCDVVLQKRLAWALFVWLLSTLVFCQPADLIWALLFHKFSNFTPPPPPPCRSVSERVQAEKAYRETLYKAFQWSIPTQKKKPNPIIPIWWTLLTFKCQSWCSWFLSNIIFWLWLLLETMGQGKTKLEHY